MLQVFHRNRHSTSRKVFPTICPLIPSRYYVQQIFFAKKDILYLWNVFPKIFLWDVMCSKFCTKKKKIYRIQERLPVLWASYSYIVYLYIVLVKMLNQQFKDSPHEPPFLTQWLQCKETELVSCKQRFSSFDQMSTLTWILIFRRNVHFACHWFNHQGNIVSNKTYMCFES